MNRIFDRLSTRAAAGTLALATLLGPSKAFASEADLILPNLASVQFFGTDGHTLLLGLGLAVCLLGLGFGLMMYTRLKNLPVHKSMLDISELIYETCKTYLNTQIKFIARLWIMIAVIMVVYFAVLFGLHVALTA